MIDYRFVQYAMNCTFITGLVIYESNQNVNSERRIPKDMGESGNKKQGKVV
jgi:hypothetical protein